MFYKDGTNILLEKLWVLIFFFLIKEFFLKYLNIIMALIATYLMVLIKKIRIMALIGIYIYIYIARLLDIQLPNEWISQRAISCLLCGSMDFVYVWN